jgi:hypothetical protein
MKQGCRDMHHSERENREGQIVMSMREKRCSRGFTGAIESSPPTE